MLRLHDDRTGRAEPLPAGPGLRVQVLDATGLRIMVVTDLLRRVVQRAARRRVRVVSTTPFPEGSDWSDFNIAPFEVLDEPIGNADVHVTGTVDPVALLDAQITALTARRDALTAERNAS